MRSHWICVFIPCLLTTYSNPVVALLLLFFFISLVKRIFFHNDED